MNVCEMLLVRQSKKTLVCKRLLYICREEKTKQILFMRSKFIFLYAYI